MFTLKAKQWLEFVHIAQVVGWEEVYDDVGVIESIGISKGDKYYGITWERKKKKQLYSTIVQSDVEGFDRQWVTSTGHLLNCIAEPVKAKEMKNEN